MEFTFSLGFHAPTWLILALLPLVLGLAERTTHSLCCSKFRRLLNQTSNGNRSRNHFVPDEQVLGYRKQFFVKASTMLTTYEIELLKQIKTSYPNYYDTDALGLTDDNSVYIKSMLKLEKLGYVESGLIETATSYVISNPKITINGMEYLKNN